MGIKLVNMSNAATAIRRTLKIKKNPEEKAKTKETSRKFNQKKAQALKEWKEWF